MKWPLIKQSATPSGLEDVGVEMRALSIVLDDGGPCYGPYLGTTVCGDWNTSVPFQGAFSPGMVVPMHVPAATLEGYGYLAPDAFDRGAAILDGAAPPSGPDWDFRVWYVEEWRGGWQELNSEGYRKYVLRR